MTLRQLTLSVNLLAASLMLAAPAQAETWSCSPHGGIVDAIKKQGHKLPPVVLVRKGKLIHLANGGYTWRIVYEDEEEVHAFGRTQITDGMEAVVLFKKTRMYIRVTISDSYNSKLPEAFQQKGPCVIH